MFAPRGGGRGVYPLTPTKVYTNPLISNLMLLCQRHHNMKTDGRITASIGYLGEVTWTGPCEEDMITVPTGPLSQDMPTGTWGQTVRAMMEQSFTRLRKEHTRE